MRFSKKVLVGILAFLLLFTIAVLYISLKTGTEPSTLVMSVFAFCGIEGGCLAWLKTVETKEESSKSKSKSKKKK